MMRSAASLALLAGATVHALPELAISKAKGDLQADIVRRGLQKRQGTVETNVFDILTYSTGGAYYANVTVGTPPQQQVVILDTGSSDLYFDASSAASCQEPQSNPSSCRGGTFNGNNSRTFHIVDPAPAFNTSFGDGSTATGPFAEDTIGIGDIIIENVQFGVAEEVNSTTGYAIGLMGVGYSENEATYVIYPNMPEVLADTGVINSRLYSVYLNDVGETSGTILFGGLDTSRFTGEMATLDLLIDQITGGVDQFITTVTGLSASVSGKTVPMFEGGSNSVAAYGNNDVSLPVLLDTGSSAWSMPSSYYQQYIAPAFSFVDKNGLCSCSHREDNTHLTVEFGAKLNITVPIREFVVPIYNATTNQPEPYNDGSEACAFMIVPASPQEDGFQTCGDAILRSMYVVFDLDEGQVSIAQAAVNSTTAPHIVTVAAGPSGVASALGSGASFTGAPSNTASIAPQATNGTASFSASTAASTIGTATGTAAVPADAQVSGTATGSSSGSGGSSSSSKGAAAGVIIPTFDHRNVWVAGISVAMMALGFGVML